MCMPGDNIIMEIEMLYPIAMEVGQKFSIREGGHTVGAEVQPRFSTDETSPGGFSFTIIEYYFAA